MRKLAQRSWRLLLLLTAVLVLAASAWAADPPIRLQVDLREAPKRLFHARLEIPAKPGPLTLVYPKWIPGEHGPTGPVVDVAGLKFTAAGKPLAWRRDDVEMFAIHLEVPAGASSLEVTLDYLSPVGGGHFSASAASTAQLAVLEWNQVLLYPQGSRTDDVMFQANLTLPPGWRFGTALPVQSESGAEIRFQPVSLTTLVDSPVIAGAHFRRVDLSPGQTPAHYIDVAGDSAESLAMSPEVEAHLKRLVAEAGALFGARHYRHYDLLLALSDHVQHFGLEHHESSDNRSYERAFLDPDQYTLFAGLLPHEYTHSWNGKYRRPAGLATPNFDEPMRGELLWVYEGLTQYIGEVLSARSGMRPPAMGHEHLAWVAAYLDHWPGREWRPLQDTAVAAQDLYGSPNAWSSWRRTVDFYDESTLIWLEADTIIRRQTQGQSSLDDFCKRFHGGQNGPPAVVPYTFDDVVKTLNQVTPYDWRSFLRARLDSTGTRAPLGGLDASGWKLVYTDQMNAYQHAIEEVTDTTDVRFSLGLILHHDNTSDDGRFTEVIHDSPAAKAGIAPGMKLIAVNGRRWSPEVLRAAIQAAKSGSAPIELLVENAEFFETHRVDYHGGQRYPHLERDASRPDLLEQITRPRTAQ